MQVRAIEPEVDNVFTLHLGFRDARMQQTYRFAPGQFNMLYMPGIGESAISISDEQPGEDTCAHTIRATGNVTRALTRLEPGDTLGLRGPFGTRWPLSECIGRDVILVAGGIGLAPLRAAIGWLLRDPRQFGRLHLLYGARSPDLLLYSRRFPAWTAHGLHVHTTVDRAVPGWSGHVGVVTRLLERLQSFDPDNTVLLCCGPEVMMHFTTITARERGITSKRIWVSLERNMQCAVGFCGHCQLGPAFICKDGPILRHDRIEPFMNVRDL